MVVVVQSILADFDFDTLNTGTGERLAVVQRQEWNIELNLEFVLASAWKTYLAGGTVAG